MSMHIQYTDDEFNQVSLDNSARLIFDRASEIYSMGNPVSHSRDSLLVLSNTALSFGLSNTAINTYYTILDSEICKNSGDYNDE